jgi:hypothetical protein
MVKRKTIIFFLIVTLASFLLILGQRFFPAVRVEDEVFSYASFYKERDGLSHFKNINKEKISDPDLEKVLINSLIEDALLKIELRRRNKSDSEIEKFVFENIKEEDLLKLAEATERLYNWSVKDFKEFILFPQARRILLVQEFEKEKIDADEWLEKSLKSATISIYLPRWKWENGEVKQRY